MSSWQVFGLTGRLLAPASQLVARTSAVTERSFLFTAAGQFRFRTGFPFHPVSSTGHREVKLLWHGLRTESIPYLGVLVQIMA